MNRPSPWRRVVLRGTTRAGNSWVQLDCGHSVSTRGVASAQSIRRCCNCALTGRKIKERKVR